MSTRSNIAKLNEDGLSATLIYCHSDGYPSYNGSVLLEHYQDEEKIDRLLALGDLSLLGAEIGERHDFEDWEFWSNNEQCRAYGRDRGEHNVQARKTIFGYEHQLCEQEYLYLWKGGEWYYSDHGGPVVELTPEICA